MVVTYNPDIARLRQVVSAVAAQVSQIMIFDNASADNQSIGPELDRFAAAGAHVERSFVNVGLAAAMNAAAVVAIKDGFEYLLLLDQDSIIDSGMVSILKNACEELAAHQLIGAVGPQFRDLRTNHVAPFVKIGFPVSKKMRGGPAELIECDFLISSGSLIPIGSLKKIGPMDERLFIDNVDLEWCFRARFLGFRLYGVCDAKMNHTLGDSIIPTYLMRRGIPVHKPIRTYYITRNRLLLYARKETPKMWIAQDIPRVVLKLFSTLIFMDQKKEHFKYMVSGFLDAIRGQTGPRSN